MPAWEPYCLHWEGSFEDLRPEAGERRTSASSPPIQNRDRGLNERPPGARIVSSSGSKPGSSGTCQGSRDGAPPYNGRATNPIRLGAYAATPAPVKSTACGSRRWERLLASLLCLDGLQRSVLRPELLAS